MRSWKECTGQGIITRTKPDEGRAKQLREMAATRLAFWNRNVGKRFVALKVEAYYEIIKELAFAHACRAGYRCSDHVCLVTYLKEKISDFEFEAEKIDELRRVRDEISRGFKAQEDYLMRNELEFKHIITILGKAVT